MPAPACCAAVARPTNGQSAPRESGTAVGCGWGRFSGSGPLGITHSRFSTGDNPPLRSWYVGPQGDAEVIRTFCDILRGMVPPFLTIKLQGVKKGETPAAPPSPIPCSCLATTLRARMHPQQPAGSNPPVSPLPAGLRMPGQMPGQTAIITYAACRVSLLQMLKSGQDTIHVDMDLLSPKKQLAGHCKARWPTGALDLSSPPPSCLAVFFCFFFPLGLAHILFYMLVSLPSMYIYSVFPVYLQVSVIASAALRSLDRRFNRSSVEAFQLLVHGGKAAAKPAAAGAGGQAADPPQLRAVEGTCLYDAIGNTWRDLRASRSEHKPLARSGHTAARLGRHVFVFGGADEDQVALGALEALDLDTGKWTAMNPATLQAHQQASKRALALAPSSSSSSSSSAVTPPVVFIDGLEPPARLGHSATAVPAASGRGSVVFFGGSSAAGAADATLFSDVHVLRVGPGLESSSWESPTVLGKREREEACLPACLPAMLLFVLLLPACCVAAVAAALPAHSCTVQSPSPSPFSCCTPCARVIQEGIWRGPAATTRPASPGGRPGPRPPPGVSLYLAAAGSRRARTRW